MEATEAPMSSRFSGKGNDGAQAHRSRSAFLVVAMALMVAGLFAQTTIGQAAPTAKNAAAPATIPGSVYTPLASPVRVQSETPLTSSTTVTPPGSNQPAADSINVTVAGGSGQAPAGATAVVLVVTQTSNQASQGNPGGGNYVQVFPAGGSTTASAVNAYFPNQLVSNLVTVPVGANNQVTVHSLIDCHVIVDEEGYFMPPSGNSTAGTYNPIAPFRIAGTQAIGQAIPGGGSGTKIQVTGVDGIPAGATAATVNLTVANDSVGGFLQTYPNQNAQPTPQTSNLNFNGGGQVVATRDVVALASDGSFTVWSNTGVNLDVDVNGWYGSATSPAGSFYYAGSGVSRVHDTRIAGDTIQAGKTLTVPVAGSPSSGVPTGATGATLNITIDKQTNINARPHDGFLEIYPGTAPAQQTSDLNFPPNSIISNADYATLASNGSITILNDSSNIVDVIVDDFGYFTTSATQGAPNTITNSPKTASVKTGGTQNISATVTNAGSPVAGDVVSFTVTGTGCGTVSPTSATSNASGVASTVYTASATGGTCTVTSSDSSGASDTTTITQTNQSYTVSCSPTTASPSTGSSAHSGELTCSATGLPANATVDLALFPTQGTNAPVANNGVWTFTPTGGNEAAGEGTTNNGAAGNGAFIENVNGNAQGTNAAGNTTTQVNGIGTGPSGQISFILNSFVTDGAYAVVWTNTDGDNALGLDPTTHQPNQPFGISQALSWSSTAAPTGTTGTFFVQSVNHTAMTFVACPSGSNTNSNPTSGCLTFNYGNTGAQSGSAYCYNGSGTSFTGFATCAFSGGGEFGVSFAQFDQWLSGYTPATPASTQPAGSPGNPAVPGDTVFVSSYNTGGPNQLAITKDVPLAPTGLTTTSPAAGSAKLTWTAPSNPDVANDTDNTAGYVIWRQQTAGTPAAGCAALNTWVKVTTTAATGGTAPATTYTDTDPCLAAGGTFSYAVAAQPNTPNGGASDIGPNSNTSSVTVASTPPPTPLAPVSTSSVLTQGGGANNTHVLDNGDTLQFLFNNGNNSGPLVVANGASFTFADFYGEQSTVTCGTNATCTVTNNGTQLNIALTGNPVQVNTASAGSGSPTPSFLNTDVGVAVVNATGVSNSAGTWNLAQSGLNCFDNFFTGTTTTITRMFDGNAPGGNTVNDNDNVTFCNASNPPLTSLPQQFSAGVTFTLPNTIHLNSGDPNAATGDPVTVYNANGAVIGSGTYNNASGTNITTTSNFNNGDLLYVVYQDTSGTLGGGGTPSNQPSESLPVGINNFVFNPSPIAPKGTLGNSQNVTVTLSGVTPNGTVYLRFGGAGGAKVNGTALTTTPQPFTADSAGNVQIIYTSSPTATTSASGTDQIQACATAACNTSRSDFYQYNAPQPNSTNSSVSASPSTVPADGTTPTNILVTVRDQNNQPIAGYSVTLSNCPGSHATIHGANPATTNASGQASFTATDTTAETTCFIATGPTQNGGHLNKTSNNVTFTVGPANAGNSSLSKDLPPSTHTDNVADDGSTLIQLTANFQDANHNVRPGDSVTVTGNSATAMLCTGESDSSGGTGCAAALTGVTAVADANGNVVVWGKDSAAETVTWTAKDTTSNNVTATNTTVFTASHPTINSVVLTNSQHSAISTYTVNFTTAHALNSTAVGGNTITLSLPCNTIIPNSTAGGYTLTNVTGSHTETITSSTTSAGHTPANWQGTPCSTGAPNEVTVNFTGAGTEGAADTYTLQIQGVTNTDTTQTGASSGPEIADLSTNADPGTFTKYNAYSIT